MLQQTCLEIIVNRPDDKDFGTQIDVARHKLQVAKEDLETAKLTFGVGQLFGKDFRALEQSGTRKRK